MASSENTTSRNGVVFTQHIWGDYYIGKLSDLVGTGKLRKEWFPGEAGNNITSMTFEGAALRRLHGLSPDITRLQIRRKDSSRKTFYVHARISETEQDHRREIERTELANAKRDEVIALARTWIVGPCSELSFKERASGYATKVIGVLLADDGLVAKSGGYSYSTDTMDKARKAVAMMKEIFLSGDVNFSAEIHQAYRIKLAREAFDRISHHYAVHDREREFDRFVAELNASLDSKMQVALQPVFNKEALNQN